MSDKLLEAMRRNPRGDWTIEDVETVCRAHGAVCRPPKRGSHAKVTHPKSRAILTIPMRKPVKAVYIRLLVDYLDKARSSHA